MKKLNNKGWGIEKMIILISFLLFVLLFIVVLTYRAYWRSNIDLIHEQEFSE